MQTEIQNGFLYFPIDRQSPFRLRLHSYLLSFFKKNPVCYSDEYNVSITLSDAWKDDRFCSILLIGAHDFWSPTARRPFMGFRLVLDHDGERFLPGAVIARKAMVPLLALVHSVRNDLQPDGRCCLDRSLEATRNIFALYSSAYKPVAMPESPPVFMN